MPHEAERGYEVGYGKPPVQSRFKKGQSGNPSGRRRGSKNLDTLVTEALDQTLIVTENGKRRTMTKREAIVTQLVNKSAEADFRAIKILLDVIRGMEAKEVPEAPEAGGVPIYLNDNQRLALDRFFERQEKGGARAA